MRTQLHGAFHKLASLLPWRWQFWHDRKWQLSSLQSALFWLLGTLAIFKLVGRFGHHGVLTTLAVSLSMDLVAYVIGKLWIWRHRDTTVPRSLARNVMAWAIMFCVNALLTWQAIGHLGTHHGRYALGGFGVLINPLVFKVRDEMIFAERNPVEEAAARMRIEMAKVMTASHSALMRVGRL